MYKRSEKWLIGTAPFIYLLIFFAIPTLIMVLASFRWPGEYFGLVPLSHQDCGQILVTPDGVENCGDPRTVIDFTWQHFGDFFTLDSYRSFFTEAVWIQTFLKSILYAGVTSLICLVMAYPLAWRIARASKRWAGLLVLLVILPFWTNFLVRIYAWMIILGPQSGLTRGLNGLLELVGMAPVSLTHNAFAVIIGLVYIHLPFMVLPLYANLEKHDPALLDAAQDLGANTWQRFWRITFPLSLPGVFAGTALVFIPALGNFAVPELLGGTDDTLIGNLIRDQFREARNWPFGSVLSIMLTLIALALLGLAVWVARRSKEADHE